MHLANQSSSPQKILDAAVTNKTFKNVIEHHRGSLQP